MAEGFGQRLPNIIVHPSSLFALQVMGLAKQGLHLHLRGSK